MAAHAIGDRAIDLVLDAYAEAQRRYPRADSSTGSSTSPLPARTRSRTAQLGVIPVPQGRFATELGDGMLAAIAPERHPWLYRQRSLLAARLTLPDSLDRPVVTGAPLLGIHDMVNRRTAADAPFNSGEAITTEQAVRAYAAGSAYASHAESTRGTVAAGRLADLVVLSDDPTAVSPASISGISVLATFTGGECRFGRVGWLAGG